MYINGCVQLKRKGWPLGSLERPWEAILPQKEGVKSDWTMEISSYRMSVVNNNQVEYIMKGSEQERENEKEKSEYGGYDR